MDTMLKIVAGFAVAESKMSKSVKRQLFNFIQKEATIPQIKAFLMDGELVSLDKEAEGIVNVRFENSIIKSKSEKIFESYQEKYKKSKK